MLKFLPISLISLLSFFPTSVPYPKVVENKLPPIVSEKDFPSQKVYHIRTRIIIDFFHMTTDDGSFTLYGATEQDIYKDLKTAEEIYSEIGLKFHVEEVLFKRFTPELPEKIIDATKHQDSVSIYYMLPNSFPMSGYSSFPWNEPFKWGILLSPNRSDHTLAHEIGHYFGLLHVFSQDYCSDTPEQEYPFCYFPSSTENCRNLMNYCPHGPKFITQEQKERFIRHLRYSRQSHIITNPRDTFGDFIDIMKRVSNFTDLQDPYTPIPTSQPTSQPTSGPVN